MSRRCVATPLVLSRHFLPQWVFARKAPFGENLPSAAAHRTRDNSSPPSPNIRLQLRKVNGESSTFEYIAGIVGLDLDTVLNTDTNLLFVHFLHNIVKSLGLLAPTHPQFRTMSKKKTFSYGCLPLRTWDFGLRNGLWLIYTSRMCHQLVQQLLNVAPALWRQVGNNSFGAVFKFTQSMFPNPPYIDPAPL